MSNYLDPKKPETPSASRQIDGNLTNLGAAPTRAPLKSRQASPSEGRSGMERAMGALADKVHKRKGR